MNNKSVLFPAAEVNEKGKSIYLMDVVNMPTNKPPDVRPTPAESSGQKSQTPILTGSDVLVPPGASTNQTPTNSSGRSEERVSAPSTENGASAPAIKDKENVTEVASATHADKPMSVPRKFTEEETRSIDKLKKRDFDKKNRQRKPCHEVDCPRCCHPCPEKKKKREKPPCKSLATMEMGEFRVKTELKIAGYGTIPVIKGDPKWLPDKVQKFIAEKARLMCPASIFICNGSVFEADQLKEILVKKGVMEQLSNYTNVYLARTDPTDTARVEKATFICHKSKKVVEPSRASVEPCEFARYMSMSHLRDELDSRFPGCMRGRTMYVIPFAMGPIAGRNSKYAIELTDSPYVVLNMRLMARVSSSVWDCIGESDFIKCIHSVGVPRPVMKKLVNNWPCFPERCLIAHMMEEKEVWSYGSGYGGNSLLGKKALALRFGSFMGLREGWLAEHATIFSVTNPAGEEFFMCASFPSGGGKTALALSTPTLPGWTIRILGDDIAWIRVGDDGKLYAMTPENGMFGIAAGVTEQMSSVTHKMLTKNALLVNAASTSKGKFFWQGIEGSLQSGEKVVDWKGKEWKVGDKNPPAHANARFTVTIDSCPTTHPLWDSPKGVPISAYIFGSKRPDAFPLVYESEDWQSGVAFGAGLRATLSSGTDKKFDGLVHDPMGMRAFLAYNFADYVKHWLNFEKTAAKRPKIFHVNWYRQGEDGKLLWPGFGENIRVLEWITERCSGKDAGAVPVPGGFLPSKINTEGLAVDPTPALSFDNTFFTKEIAEMKKFFNDEMGNEQPEALVKLMDTLAGKVAQK